MLFVEIFQKLTSEKALAVFAVLCQLVPLYSSVLVEGTPDGSKYPPKAIAAV
jgi:hypothetical protein